MSNNSMDFASKERVARLAASTKGLGTLLRDMKQALDAGQSPGNDLMLRMGFERLIEDTSGVVEMLEALREAHRAGSIPESLWADVDRALGQVNNVSSGRGDIVLKVFEEKGRASHTQWRYMCGMCHSSGNIIVWSGTPYASMEGAVEAAKNHIAVAHRPEQDIIISIGHLHGRIGLNPGPFNAFCSACNKVAAQGKTADEADCLFEVHRWRDHPDIENVGVIILDAKERPIEGRTLNDLGRTTEVAEFHLRSEDISWKPGEGVHSKPKTDAKDRK